MSSETTAILGIPIATMTSEEVVQKTFELIEQRQRPHYLATVNVDFLNNTHRCFSLNPHHPDLLRALRDADIVTADGMPLVWLSKHLGTPFPERVAGADLFPRLIEAAAERQKAVFFLGGSEEVTRQACEKLQKQHPSLHIAGIAYPQIDLGMPHDALVDTINAAHPDILFLNLGNPKQELWFQSVKERLHVPMTIGIGGTLNFVAGTTSRAPRFLQRLGFEWMYRLYQEPRRLWRRYLLGFFKIIFLTAPLLTYHYLCRLRVWNIPPGAASIESVNDHYDLVHLPEVFSGQVPLSDKTPIFDFTKVRHITADGVAVLLKKHPLYSFGIQKHLRRLLKLHRVWDIISPYHQNSLHAILENIQQEPL
jgi:N-acetylglucosaminyldiphosphoundecaprenol N-acetyl-beta-D-mannosaminyltransferase